MLWDEAGAHVSGLELRVAGKTQQKVDVGVESNDLKTGGNVVNANADVQLVQPPRLRLTLYWRKQYRSFFRAAGRSSPHTTSLAIIGS